MSDYIRYQELKDQFEEDNAPQWNDPATKYIKQSIVQKMPNMTQYPGTMMRIDLGQNPSNHFLYPLCNSPKRKQYYQEMQKDYKEELK